MAALTVEEALARILGGASPLEAEDVDLLAAHGRTLARDVVARLTQPPFDASAMDGYAVRAADVARLPARLTVVGEAAAGRAHPRPIRSGEAVRIFTGAPLPAGADAIVIQENTRVEATSTQASVATVEVHDGRPDATHIRPRGGDFSAGAVILATGRTLDARALTLAAAAGHERLPVRRRPVVAIIATGNELVPPGATPGTDQIVSSNPVGLAAMLAAFGAAPRLLGIARDTLDDTLAMLDAAGDADIVVTTGGASVGDHDLVRPAFVSLGVTLEFWTLAMRPGKPMIYGRRGRQHVLGLPGNPVSALITARLFAVPLVNALLGRPLAATTPLMAETTCALPANGPRQHFMRATLETGDGRSRVTPVPDQDSSLLSPLANANALLIRPAGASALLAGAQVLVMRIDF